MEENFLLLFRFDNPLESSVEFMKVSYSINHLTDETLPIVFITSCFWQIWREYDSDNSGYIEADELKNFLRDLLKEAKKINDVSEDKLIEYTDTMVSLVVYLLRKLLYFIFIKFFRAKNHERELQFMRDRFLLGFYYLDIILTSFLCVFVFF